MANAPERLSILIAAPAEAAGVTGLLEAAVAEARSGAEVRVLLTDAGLALLSTTWPERFRKAGIDASLCSRSAREAGTLSAAVPPGVRWSSLTAFLRDDAPAKRLWAAFP